MSTVRNELGSAAGGSSTDARPPAREHPAEPRVAGLSIVAEDGAIRAPLSPAQQRLWFLEQLQDLGSAYYVAAYLRFHGTLDRGALSRALNALVARHDALRTTFPVIDGMPVQRIAPAAGAECPLVVHDLSGEADPEAELQRRIVAQVETPFDLQQGPLFRNVLFRLGPDEHLLLHTMHHIVFDGWSLGVLTEDLGALYAGCLQGDDDALPPLPVAYAEYMARQREARTPAFLAARKPYWEEVLAGAPALLDLPTDHPRPAVQQFGGGTVEIQLDEALTGRLRALAERQGTTLFRTLLSAWAIVMGRLSGQPDVLVGVPMSNREPEDAGRLIGFFVDTVVVRVDLSGSPTAADVLQQVHRRTREARRHQEVPLEDLVSMVAPVRNLSYHSLYQTGFSWHNVAKGALSLPGLRPLAMEEMPRPHVPLDTSLGLWEDGQGIAGRLDYATSLFDHETVERWVGYLRQVLDEMAADEHRPVERLALLPADQRAQILDAWNRTDAAYPSASCLHELFEAQVDRTPDAVALSFDADQLTYAELNRRANRLAHHLRALGVGPDVLVGLCVERSLEMMVGLLAVLKAGGAYVALDPSYPEDRLRYMLSDSAPAVLLTQSALRGRFDGISIPVVSLDSDASSWADHAATNPAKDELTPNHLAYVIYTSGSTGRPKGVMVAHRSIVNALTWMQGAFGIDSLDSVLQKTPYSFDASLRELIPPLLGGARFVMARPEGHRDAEYLLDTIRRERITTLHFVPSMLQVLVDEADFRACTTLGRVVCGGEALPRALADRFRAALPETRLFNVYGPTEAAVDVTAWNCDSEQGGEGSIPIGRPMANVRLYVLDRVGEPVPAGVAGELFIGGAQVARGYLARPAMTAERFVPDPFSNEPGARLYRTGDLARWRMDGAVDFLGRGDAQVKVRGFRIELGEIEARFREHPAVRESVVIVREESGDRRLVAYWLGDAVEVEPLKTHLAHHLPSYMVPAAFVRLEDWPRTPNGKLDRRALPAPEEDAFAAREYEAPEGEMEQALADIWAELLGISRIGRQDNFFELGGHSLLAVQVISRLRRRGLHADVRTLFTAPTLAALAAGMGAESPEVAVPANGIPAGCDAITPEMLPLVALEQAEIDAIVAAVPGGAANVQDIYPLAPLQDGILFHHLMAQEGDPYLVWSLLGFERRDDLDRYLGAFRQVVGRHDILRTGVMWEGLPEPVQVVWRQAPLRVEEVALDPAEGDAPKQLRAMFDPRHHRIDVREAPMVRVYVTRQPADGRWLLLVLSHHLTGDHTAKEVLQREIEAILSGHAGDLPHPVPFRTYVAQARLGLGEDEHRAFFSSLLGDVDEPTAPFGLMDARGDGSDVREARLLVDAGLSARVRERARALGVTTATLCHTAWAQVLARVSGRGDVVFGTVLFGRMQGGEGADRTMGPFINTLPIRIRVGDDGAETSVRETHALLARLLRHEHASLALAQRCSGVDPSAPLFTSLLNYRHAAPAAPSPASMAIEGMRVIHGGERSNYPLGLAVDDGDDAFRLTVQAAHDSPDPARVCRYVHTALEALVDALETAPQQALASLDVLPAAERRQVVEEWNATLAPRPGHRCVHELVEAWAERTPDAVALNVGGETFTFAELNRRANRLAHHLRALGVRPEMRVGVCAERSLEMVIGPLAVMKAGGAFVPLDPALPDERLGWMVEDSAAALVLSQRLWTQRFGGMDVPVLPFGERTWAHAPSTNPTHDVLGAANTAYVIYTSGSTGLPKGVVVPHRGVTALVDAQDYSFETGPASRVMQNLSFGFDACVWEVYTAIGRGAMLHVPPPGLLPGEELKDTVARHQFTHLMLTTATVATLAPDERMASVRTLMVGGEALTDAVAKRWAEGRRLFNGYGPTEATIGTTFHHYRPGESLNGGVPIGRPFANWRVYVLDARGEPVPIGAVGEMHIGSAGVVRGYLNRPALTAERFVPDAFSDEPGARLYRTGDLGRWRADGTLEFVGRNDHQVKIRGFRVEPGEVESRLMEHAAVREAAVVPREDAPGQRRLVAYFVADDEVGADALRAHLGERLPDFMVPAAYVRLDHLPLTPNGKLDRKALPAPEAGAFATRGYEAPAGETEQALADIWAAVLGVERVSRRDHFFDLGGHSLLAIQVISRVRQVLEVKVELGELFQRPVFEDFARALEMAARAGLPPVEPAPRDGRVPLSLAQTRLWFLEQLGDLGSAYHIRAPYRLRGELDRAALIRALDRIVARHEALRTTFAEMDGVPEQRFAPSDASRFHLTEHDVSGEADAEDALERLMAEETAARFDLQHGPLIRGRLIRMGEDDHVLLLTMHHIVSDGWSMGVLFEELAALYDAFRNDAPDPLPPLAVQYADYAIWQRQWMEGDVLQAQADYWTQALAGAPELLELPTDRPRPAQADRTGAWLGLELDEALTAGLKALSRRHGTTLFMTVLAGWAVVLSRLSGQDEVVIGTPIAGRGRREIEDLIGFFINTLPLRLDLSDAPPVAELMERAKRRSIDAQHHQDIPFEQVVELVDPARSLSHNPLFQVAFAWQDTGRRGGLALAGLDVGRIGAAQSQAYANTDLHLSLWETGDRIVGRMTYATALFGQDTVERHAGYLRRVLEEMVAGEHRSVDQLELLPVDERQLVVDEWNRSDAPYPNASCVHELFEAQVDRTPDAEALVSDGQRFTYAELNARANRLAHHLRSLGVGPDVRVGISVERSAEMVIGLLAVLKSGGAYVPLDPSYPADRLAYMLADSTPAVLMTQQALRGRFEDASVPLLLFDADASTWDDHPSTSPERDGLTPEHLAYVIYTSGSTGRPKGVMVGHRGACNLVTAQVEAFGVEADSRVLQFASFSFDASVSEVLMALCTGAALHLPPRGALLAGDTLVRALDGITHVTLPPAVLASFADDERLDSVRTLILAGDAMPEAAAKRWGMGRRLINAYGPTEATVCATLHEVREDEIGSPPIGRPMANARVYVLDGRGDPVPVGVIGELYIGGAGVTRGYLGRPDLTAEKFVADPFGEPGARLYRTGDLGRWRADGTLDFIGRGDHQVKVRGFRIELGEIESRLIEHSSVREAVVLAREDVPGDDRLVAYVVGDEAATTETLRSHLAERLPEYMLPSVFVRLDEWPLTPNGKIDRKSLPAPEAEDVATQAYEAPVGGTEQALAEVWAEVLGLDRVGRRDHFFELGGHSLLAVQVISRLRELGLHLEVQALFEAPTLMELAAELAGESPDVEVPANGIPAGCRAITPHMLPLVSLTQAQIDAIAAAVPGGAANVQDIYPLARLQEGVLFHHLMSTDGDPYLSAILNSFDSRESVARYIDAFQAVVSRHDILRTAVMWEGLPEPVQVVLRRAPLSVEEVELDAAEGDAAEQLRARFDPRHHRIDVREAPMVRVCIARDPADGRWLFLLLDHHLTGDHTAKEVLQREIEAILSGRAHDLPEPLPFRNYVAQARLGVSEDEHRAFFAEMLGDVDEPTAPFGLLDVRGDGSGMDEARLRVDGRLAARLRERARTLGVSTATVFHLAWAQVLARVSGRDDVVFGTVLFGRMQGGEGSDRVMGPFINTLPIRLDVGDSGAETSVRETHALLARLLRHEHASLALAQRCSGVDAAMPLFTSLLNYRHGGTAKASAMSIEGMRILRGEERSNYPLTLAVTDWGDDFGLTAKVKRPFDAGRVAAMVHGSVAGLVDALERSPDRPLRRIDILPADERARVVADWNRTEAEYPAEACIHHLIEAQTARTPNATAVVSDHGNLTYADLNARANRLAHHLRALGVGPDARVGICIDRSLEMVIGLLAILKAGGAYVPLDPEYPADRLAYMLADSAPAVVLTQTPLRDRVDGAGVPVIALDADSASWADQPATDPERGSLTPEHLAYVIYTSGSTGRPKGVMNQHRTLVNRLSWGMRTWEFDASEAVLCKTSLNFDGSVREIFLPLMAGGRVVLARPGGQRDPSYLLDVIAREGITTVNLVPSMLQVLLEDADVDKLRGLERILCGGEALPNALLERFVERLPDVELHNLYGPSEAATAVALPRPVAEAGRATVPIGRPVANTRVYVLDRAGEPVPVGVAGELHIGGAGVARGYLDRPDQTAERFVADPFSAEPGARMYRTGDRVRWLDDGTLEFLGRTDFQLKIRGFRIEPGDIEARLVEHPGVRDAIVAAREDQPGEKRLVAYVVGDESAGAETLRAHLGQALPDYMVPAAYVRLDQWPLTPSGKLDRAALPAPEDDAYAARAYEAPIDETEEALAEIWADVLGIERVGRWDSFFELGGHSLLAVQVISRVRQAMEVEVPLSALFTMPVLSDLAQEIVDLQVAQFDPDELAELAALLR